MKRQFLQKVHVTGYSHHASYLISGETSDMETVLEAEQWLAGIGVTSQDVLTCDDFHFFARPDGRQFDGRSWRRGDCIEYVIIL